MVDTTQLEQQRQQVSEARSKIDLAKAQNQEIQKKIEQARANLSSARAVRGVQGIGGLKSRQTAYGKIGAAKSQLEERKKTIGGYEMQVSQAEQAIQDQEAEVTAYNTALNAMGSDSPYARAALSTRAKYYYDQMVAGQDAQLALNNSLSQGEIPSGVQSAIDRLKAQGLEESKAFGYVLGAQGFDATQIQTIRDNVNAMKTNVNSVTVDIPTVTSISAQSQILSQPLNITSPYQNYGSYANVRDRVDNRSNAGIISNIRTSVSKFIGSSGDIMVGKETGFKATFKPEGLVEASPTISGKGTLGTYKQDEVVTVPGTTTPITIASTFREIQRPSGFQWDTNLDISPEQFKKFTEEANRKEVDTSVKQFQLGDINKGSDIPIAVQQRGTNIGGRVIDTRRNIQGYGDLFGVASTLLGGAISKNIKRSTYYNQVDENFAGSLLNPNFAEQAYFEDKAIRGKLNSLQKEYQDNRKALENGKITQEEYNSIQAKIMIEYNSLLEKTTTIKQEEISRAPTEFTKGVIGGLAGTYETLPFVSTPLSVIKMGDVGFQTEEAFRTGNIQEGKSGLINLGIYGGLMIGTRGTFGIARSLGASKGVLKVLSPTIRTTTYAGFGALGAVSTFAETKSVGASIGYGVGTAVPFVSQDFYRYTQKYTPIGEVVYRKPVVPKGEGVPRGETNIGDKPIYEILGKDGRTLIGVGDFSSSEMTASGGKSGTVFAKQWKLDLAKLFPRYIPRPVFGGNPYGGSLTMGKVVSYDYLIPQERPSLSFFRGEAERVPVKKSKTFEYTPEQARTGREKVFNYLTRQGVSPSNANQQLRFFRPTITQSTITGKAIEVQGAQDYVYVKGTQVDIPLATEVSGKGYGKGYELSSSTITGGKKGEYFVEEFLKKRQNPLDNSLLAPSIYYGTREITPTSGRGKTKTIAVKYTVSPYELSKAAIDEQGRKAQLFKNKEIEVLTGDSSNLQTNKDIIENAGLYKSQEKMQQFSRYTLIEKGKARETTTGFSENVLTTEMPPKRMVKIFEEQPAIKEIIREGKIYPQKATPKFEIYQLKKGEEAKANPIAQDITFTESYNKIREGYLQKMPQERIKAFIEAKADKGKLFYVEPYTGRVVERVMSGEKPTFAEKKVRTGEDEFAMWKEQPKQQQEVSNDIFSRLDRRAEATKYSGTESQMFTGVAQFSEVTPSRQIRFSSVPIPQPLSLSRGARVNNAMPRENIQNEFVGIDYAEIEQSLKPRGVIREQPATILQPQTKPQIEIKAEVRTEPKIEAKPEVRTNLRIEPELKIQPQIKLQPKLEPKIELKIQPKVEPRIEPKVRPTPRPKPRIPILPSSKSERARELLTKARKAYSVRVWKGGKPITIAKGLPEGKAKKLASLEVLKTARASFELVPEGFTSQEDINFKLSSIFRPSKRNPNRMVQQLNTRLSSRGEVKEVLSAKRKGKKIKWL